MKSGEPLTDWQKLGLDLVARWQGRDVILAIDLTGSVNFNDEGRTRLGQIIRDSLKNNDSVYLVPFADNVQPITEPILIRGREDIDAVLKSIPWQSTGTLKSVSFNCQSSYQTPVGSLDYRCTPFYCRGDYFTTVDRNPKK
ncbi:MAG: VWA domain-containing protein [Microcystis sp. 53602_E8]|nr:VWA domain-containing protein [Microcystis sp. 53602_E8]